MQSCMAQLLPGGGPPTRPVVLKVRSGLTRKTTNLVSCRCSRPLKETVVTYIHHNHGLWGNFALVQELRYFVLQCLDLEVAVHKK